MSDGEVCRACGHLLVPGPDGHHCAHCRGDETEEYEGRPPAEVRTVTGSAAGSTTTLPANNPSLETGSRAETLKKEESDRRPGEPMNSPDVRDGPGEDNRAPAGRRFGTYLLIRELGRGGMGVVYEAIQIGLNRSVALKRIRNGAFATGKDLLRFRGEAQVIATLDHPNIVPIYEVGEHQEESFFSMKLFEGKDLRSRLADFRGRSRDIARLAATIADAVHYAHQRGVLHRDLKPSNILLDAGGQPHLIDFGLAFRLDLDEQPSSEGIAGTPNYMAPEQASGLGATTLSDVYGLGTILYALLTGHPPFQGMSTQEMLRNVIETEPVRPSQLAAAVDRDLEVICLKCLAKKPAQRYPTAKELAEDLESWLVGEPIRARSYSTLERVVLWARRWPTVAALWAGFVAAVVAGSIGIVAALLLARHHERQAITREEEAHKQAYVAMIRLGARDYRDGNIGRLLETLEQTRPSEGRADLRGFEWYYLRSLCRQDRRTLETRIRTLRAFDFNPDGSRMIVVGDDGRSQVWDASTGELIQSLLEKEAGLRSVAFGRDGREFATGSTNGEVKLRDAATGGLVRPFVGLNGTVLEVAFSPDGKQLAAAGQAGRLLAWEVASGRLLHELKGHAPGSTISQVAYSGDGKWLAAVATDNSLRIWNPSDGQLVKSLEGIGHLPRCLDFSDDGSKLAVAAGEKVILLSTRDWARIREFRAGLNNDLVLGLDLRGDGTMLVTGGYDQVVRVWDVATGSLLREYRGHVDTIREVKFHPKLSLIASGDGIGSVKIWGIEDEQDFRPLTGHGGKVTSLRYSPSGSWFASAGEDGAVLMWETATRKVFRTLRGHEGTIAQISISPDGTRLASAGRDGTLRIFDVTTGNLVHRVADKEALDCVSFSPDGRFVAYAGQGRDIGLWDVDRGRVVRTLRGHNYEVTGLCFSPDGSRMASCGGDSRILIWDVASGRRLGPDLERVEDGSRWTNRVAFSPDGRWLAAAGRNRVVRLWDSRTGRLAHTLNGHMEAITDIAFSPDGRRLVSSGADCLRIWDVGMGRELMAFEPYESQGRAVGFSPRGDDLVSARDDNVIRVRGFRNSP
jgi:WD40 repeat protein